MAKKTQDTTAEGIASPAQNEKLEHTDSGVTTRDDVTDLGVPMLPGDPSEPIGPEDALGAGPKRGDYSQRLGTDGYQPHQVVPVPDAAPGEPQVQVVAQRPHASEQGDEAGVKGGVDTV
jgi:hypothetical protein